MLNMNTNTHLLYINMASWSKNAIQNWNPHLFSRNMHIFTILHAPAPQNIVTV